MRPRPRDHDLQLRDGSSVAVRPLERDDRDRLARAVERLSEDSRYRRFFTPLPRLTPTQLDHLTDVDHSDHEALAAIDSEGEIVGVARYMRSDAEPQVAEAAVAVGDTLQGRGLGRALLERLVERAREEGVTCFTALVQADNPAAIHALEGLGETSRTSSGPEVELRIELPERRGLSDDLEHALRSAAAGSVVAAGSLLGRMADAARRRPGRRPPPRRGGRIETIVAGTDGSDGAGRAVRAAAELARRLGAELHLVTAFAPAIESRLRRAADALAPGDAAGPGTTSRDTAQRVLDEAVAAARGDDLEPAGHARDDDPASALVDVAEEQGADLIVVGSRGMAGSRRSLLGSVPDKISHHAPCSVLVVKTE